MKQFIFISTLLFLAVGVIQAHEGHDKTPGALASPHGGVVKGAGDIYLELVSDSGGVKIYPLDHDTKAIPVSEIKLAGKMSIPRKNKTEVVPFKAESDHFVAKIDAKGAHRYDLDVTVTQGGKTKKLKFSVEPQ